MEKKKNDFIAQGSILAIAFNIGACNGNDLSYSYDGDYWRQGKRILFVCVQRLHNFAAAVLIQSSACRVKDGFCKGTIGSVAQRKESIYMCNCICNRYWYDIWFDCINWCAVFTRVFSTVSWRLLRFVLWHRLF